MHNASALRGPQLVARWHAWVGLGRRTAGEALDPLIEGSREEQRLAVRPHRVKQRANLGLEPQVKHAVCLVQHHIGRPLEVGRLCMARA
jgi:hypothetical protein